MGLYDYITCEAPTPKYGDISRFEGQTKRFFRNFSRFNITRDGQLLQLLAGGLSREQHHADSEFTRRLQFHGDVAFVIGVTESIDVKMVARFNHGQLESIRLIEDLSEEEKLLLYTPQE
jgi:hypothetical protein